MLSGVLATLIYAVVFLAAVFLLYWFRPVRWYWHIAAITAAFGIGLAPPLAQWNGPIFDLLMGATFTLLFVWGIGELFFKMLHLHHHHEPR